MKLIWICHLEKIFSFTFRVGGVGDAQRWWQWQDGYPAITEKVEFKSSWRSPSFWGWRVELWAHNAEKLQIHRDRHLVSSAKLKGSNCLWYDCPWVAWLEVLKVSAADLISLAKTDGHLPPSSWDGGSFFASSSWQNAVQGPLLVKYFESSGDPYFEQYISRKCMYIGSLFQKLRLENLSLKGSCGKYFYKMWNYVFCQEFSLSLFCEFIHSSVHQTDI